MARGTWILRASPCSGEFSWWQLRQRGCWRTVAIFPHAANLIVLRDWSVMRRRVAAKVQTNFIDIAPSPPFRRIVAFDDGMAGLRRAGFDHVDAGTTVDEDLRKIDRFNQRYRVATADWSIDPYDAFFNTNE